MLTWEQRFDMITTHAWETWTNNGNRLSPEEMYQTTRSVQDAVGNEYQDGMSDEAWLDATLKRLGHKADGFAETRAQLDELAQVAEGSHRQHIETGINQNRGTSIRWRE